MKIAELVAELEGAGTEVTVAGERVVLRASAECVPPPEVVARLRQEKPALLAYLRQREASNQGQSRPDSSPALEASQDAERRFGQPHAKLFPFIGRKVRTPRGAGTLLLVFAERAEVLLDSRRDACEFFLPGEIEPVSWELP